MKETVAIIGSHPATREEFDWSRTDADIWGFNEALKADWFERADGIFQIHKPVIWRSKTNRNDPDHYQWLQSGKTPVIFMQDKFADVPQSERYPIEEVMALAPGIGYFTSSVAYAIALAILKGYKRIEVYGVEMETNTEYGHQRVGVAFWCGVAMGMGIEVDFHSPSFFSAPLYGYDGDVRVPIPFFEEQMAQAQKHRQGAQGKFDEVKQLIDGLLAEFVKTYKTNLDDLDMYILALRDNAMMIGQFDGITKVCERYIQNCQTMIDESGDYLIARQEFEGQGIGAKKQIGGADQRMRQQAEILQQKRKTLNTNANRDKRKKLVKEFDEALQAFIKPTVGLGAFQGIMNINSLLMKKHDELLQASGITNEEAEAIPVEMGQAVPV